MKKFLTSVFILFSPALLFAEQGQDKSFCYKKYSGTSDWVHLSGNKIPQELGIAKKIASDVETSTDGLCKNFAANLNIEKNKNLIIDGKDIAGENDKAAIVYFSEPDYRMECSTEDKKILSPDFLKVSCHLLIRDQKDEVKTLVKPEIISPFKIVDGKVYADLYEVNPGYGEPYFYCMTMTVTRNSVDIKGEDIESKRFLKFNDREFNGAEKLYLKKAMKKEPYAKTYILTGVSVNDNERVSEILTEKASECFSQVVSGK